MANIQAFYGLVPVSHMTGGCIYRRPYTIASGYAANIFRGDPVKPVAAGTIEIAAGGTTNPLGVFDGVSYKNAAGQMVFSPYWPSGTVATEITAWVYDDPLIIFKTRSDATGVAAADIGAQADWEIVAGSTATGWSKTNLDASAAIGATQAGLRVISLVQDGLNAPGAYSEVLVTFSEHFYLTTPAGI